MSENRKKILQELKQEEIKQGVLNFENELKKPSKQENGVNKHYIDLACFEYIGENEYYHKDEKGKGYKIEKGDHVYLSNDEMAFYMRYKKTLFREIDV